MSDFRGRARSVRIATAQLNCAPADAEGELVFWGGSHVLDPRGRTVAQAPLYTEGLVMAEVDLAGVARRRREMPLLENPRLYLLLQELGRLTTNREEAGVQGPPPARPGS